MISFLKYKNILNEGKLWEKRKSAAKDETIENTRSNE